MHSNNRHHRNASACRKEEDEDFYLENTPHGRHDGVVSIMITAAFDIMNLCIMPYVNGPKTFTAKDVNMNLHTA